MNRENEEPQGASSVGFRVPDFVGEDGVTYSDIEVIVEMDGDIRDAVQLVKTLERPLTERIGGRTSGFLFQTESGRPLTQRNVLRDGLGKIRRDMKFEDGKAFHAFRRFRTAHLRKNRTPWDLQKLWLGHANKDVTDRYAEQLKEDVDWREQEAERVGLGFRLPAIESSVGLLGLPTQQESQLKKVA